MKRIISRNEPDTLLGLWDFSWEGARFGSVGVRIIHTTPNLGFHYGDSQRTNFLIHCKIAFKSCFFTTFVLTLIG
jgi:hypothetical protein